MTALAGLTGAAAMWFRGILAARSALRTDATRSEERQGVSEAFTLLRDEVKRQGAVIADISTKLGKEVAARRESDELAIKADRRADVANARADAAIARADRKEAEVAGLKFRIETLEAQISVLTSGLSQ